MTAKQSEEQPEKVNMGNWRQLVRDVVDEHPGVFLPNYNPNDMSAEQSPPTTLSEERLRDLKNLYEDCQKSPPEISYGDQHAAPWIFFNAIYDAFPSLLRSAEQMARYQWKPIESAPKDGASIIGLFGKFPYEESHSISWWAQEKTWTSPCYPSQPTHWMSLPPAPEKGGAA